MKEIEIIKTQMCRVIGFLHCADGSLIKWRDKLPNRPAVCAVRQAKHKHFSAAQLRLQSLALHPHTMVMFPPPPLWP